MITIELWCKNHMRILQENASYADQRAIIALDTRRFTCKGSNDDACMDTWTFVVRGGAFVIGTTWQKDFT